MMDVPANYGRVKVIVAGTFNIDAMGLPSFVAGFQVVSLLMAVTVLRSSLLKDSSLPETVTLMVFPVSLIWT